MELEVSSAVLGRLRAEAAAAHPHECCGLLLGEGLAVTRLEPARNVHPQPDRHFEIDPRALIDAFRAGRAGGPQVLGYYHSHPVGAPAPSPTDRAEAAHDGRVWAIIAGNAVSFWRDAPDGFEALSYVVRDA
ncbi:M67 family metallopeptidase [Altererythrobacter sp. H2]|nr:M67 family metallopeptidase [Altererythrobacter sp. H2]WRK97363.1 M67 family metallopeptidase [Altererythrobacter sp. H2]